MVNNSMIIEVGYKSWVGCINYNKTKENIPVGVRLTSVSPLMMVSVTRFILTDRVSSLTHSVARLHSNTTGK